MPKNYEEYREGRYNFSSIVCLNLKDTTEFMISDEYPSRFAAEYFQLKIRYEKLSHLLIQHEAKTLQFKLDCPIDLLQKQLKIMEEYLHILEIRAELEDIYFR